MAVPQYVTTSTYATDAGGAWTATGAAPGAAGRIIILQVLQDGTTDGAVTFTSATNIENLAGTDNQWTAIGEFSVGASDEARQYLWIGRSLSTSAPTFTGGNSTSEDLYFAMYEFSGVSTGTTLATVIENVTAGTATGAAGTSTTVADVGVTTLGTDRLALNFIAVNDDPQAAELTAMTGETGGDWTYPVVAYGESSGTDGTIALVTAQMASAGTINGGTDTITSGAWGVVGFALKPEGVPLLSQTEAAFYEDGTEAGATVIDAGADSITRDLSGGNSTLQLRVRLQETNASNGLSTDDYQLQYEKNDSGSWVNASLGSVLKDSYDPTVNSATNLSSDSAAAGQSFQGQDTQVVSAQFKLAKNGTPTGNLFAKIYLASGSLGTTAIPTGSVLATSDAFSIASLTGSSTFVSFTFTGAEQVWLSSSNVYVLVVQAGTGTTLSGVAPVTVGQRSTDGAHAGNKSENLSGSGWTATATTDFAFKLLGNDAVVVGFNSTSLTDGNATTNRLGSGTGSFVAGEISEDGLVDNFTHTASNYTEHLYSLVIESTAVADNDTLDFRVLRNGATTGMTYTVTPRITIEKTAGTTTSTSSTSQSTSTSSTSSSTSRSTSTSSTSSSTSISTSSTSKSTSTSSTSSSRSTSTSSTSQSTSISTSISTSSTSQSTSISTSSTSTSRSTSTSSTSSSTSTSSTSSSISTSSTSSSISTSTSSTSQSTSLSTSSTSSSISTSTSSTSSSRSTSTSSTSTSVSTSSTSSSISTSTSSTSSSISTSSTSSSTSRSTSTSSTSQSTSTSLSTSSTSSSTSISTSSTSSSISTSSTSSSISTSTSLSTSSTSTSTTVSLTTSTSSTSSSISTSSTSSSISTSTSSTSSSTSQSTSTSSTSQSTSTSLSTSSTSFSTSTTVSGTTTSTSSTSSSISTSTSISTTSSSTSISTSSTSSSISTSTSTSSTSTSVSYTTSTSSTSLSTSSTSSSVSTSTTAIDINIYPRAFIRPPLQSARVVGVKPPTGNVQRFRLRS